MDHRNMLLGNMGLKKHGFEHVTSDVGSNFPQCFLVQIIKHVTKISVRVSILYVWKNSSISLYFFYALQK